MAGTVSDHPLWREDGEDGYNQAAEALEKLVPPPSLSLSHSFISSPYLLPSPYFFPPLPLPFSHSFIYSPFLLRPLIYSLHSPSLTHSFIPPFFSAPLISSLLSPSLTHSFLPLFFSAPLISSLLSPYFFPPLPFSHSFIYSSFLLRPPYFFPPLPSSFLRYVLYRLYKQVFPLPNSTDTEDVSFGHN